MKLRTGSQSKYTGWALVCLSLIITYSLWIGSKWYYQAWFPNNWWYLSKIGAFGATILMSWSIILSTRLTFVERLFGGLDKAYQAHKKMGKWAFYLVLLHPLALAFRAFPDGWEVIKFFRLYEWNVERYLTGHNLGIVALISFFVLVALSLWVYLPYHIWKLSHNLFGLVYLLVVVHIILVDANVSAYPLFRIWMYLVLGVTLVCYLYIRFFYRRFGPRFEYQVADIELVSGVQEITLIPRGEKKMMFYPGQFAYIKFDSVGVKPEIHPYSMACAVGKEGQVKFGIKSLGDHTNTLYKVSVGDPVTLYGSYGTFARKFLTESKECVFIGGGIGITPFQSMWDAAMNSPDVADDSEKMEAYDPEHVNTWKSPLVHLFYVVKEKQEASFHNDIIRESLRSQFNGAKLYHQRGHSYHLYEAKKMGYISADYIEEQIGDLKNKHIFMCGPSPMTSSLIKQFKEKGVPNNQIITEDFNLIDHNRGKWLRKLLS